MKENSSKNFYITTTLPYVNSDPHIGFAAEIIRADAIARYKKLMGFDVFFNTGTDEHGLKIYKKAIEEGVEVQKYVDKYAAKFEGLKEILGLSSEMHFIRTTDEHHVRAAQEFWKLCDKAGDIYKKTYKVKYCVGCELEKTESELVDGKCPIHPQLSIELIDEENYFFRFSKYRQALLDLYEKNPKLVIPNTRFNEIRAFVDRGPEDFSISRLANKMPWGVPVPGDENQVMYVWFDALINYISTLGWPENTKQFEDFWKNGTPVQYCGKDNLRQQSAMWQAMLLSANLPATHAIIIDGFVTGAGGVKMSKSLGNVVNPYDIVNEYGTDALRYFVLRELQPFEDSPFTMEQFKQSYNANLANGLGNLVSRVMKMATTNGITFDDKYILELSKESSVKEFYNKQKEGFESFNIQMAMDAIWKVIAEADGYIQREQPFKKIKSDKESGEADLKKLLAWLDIIGTALIPLLPTTAQFVIDCVRNNKMPEKPLFMRKD